jgi:hypothetical protein
MPLTTKKKGIRRPSPTAVSFDSNTSTSRPWPWLDPRRVDRQRLKRIRYQDADQATPEEVTTA